MDERPLKLSDDDGNFADEVSIRADDGNVKYMPWFKHGPIKAEDLCHIESIQLVAESRDQGWVNDPSAGNWTWFELYILDNLQATAPAIRDEMHLVWESHRTPMGCKIYQRIEGPVLGRQHDLFRYLKAGDFIAVRLCARFQAWELSAKNGELIIRKTNEEISRADVDHRPALHAIASAHAFLSNIQNYVQNDKATQLVPSLPTTLNVAMTFAPTEDRPLRVLSLDGGGVRGLASLVLLEKIMDLNHSGKKPCDVFDMIGGTSTGGLIAIMLGCLKMSVTDCIETYKNVMNQVFSGWARLRYVRTGYLYDDEKLRKIIKGCIEKQLGEGDGATVLLRNGTQKCKVFVTATRDEGCNNHGPVILRSYVNPGAPSEYGEITILQAAMATTAAPGYFKPVKIITDVEEGTGDTLVDGGLCANNPVGWLWTEMLGVFGAARPTDCFLSIGTGIDANSDLVQPGKYRVPLLSTVESFASVGGNTETMHILFQGLIDAFAPWPGKPKYWRLNVHKVIKTWSDVNVPDYVKKQHDHTRENYEKIPKLDDVEGAKGGFMDMLEEYVKGAEVKESIENCSNALKHKETGAVGQLTIQMGWKDRYEEATWEYWRGRPAIQEATVEA